MAREFEIADRLLRRSGKRTKKAYELLKQAHELGDARATYALGTWYLHGTRYTRRDTGLAIELLTKAAASDIPDAAHDLAVSLEKGTGVRKSAARAFQQYTKAALLGERQSYYEVGRMYYYGIGTRKNRYLADIWLHKAETLGIRK